MDYPKFKVTVSCMTYNQSKYITDAMNGFTMQQTSFPFVCTIVDDASTDDEQEVISKYVEDNFDFSEGSVAYHKETDYANITYAQHKANKNCYFAVLYLKENHYSQSKDKMGYLSEWRDICEYEALCEGDDYWIVPDKLEMQVEFLDKNENYGLVYTRTQHLLTTNQLINEPLLNRCDTRSLLKSNPIRTLTVLLRIKLYKQYTDYTINVFQYSYDYPMFLWFSYYSKIKYFDKITGVYRILANSASHSDNPNNVYKFQETCLKVRMHWAEIVGLDLSVYEYDHLRLCYYFAFKRCDEKGLINYRKKLIAFNMTHKYSFRDAIIYFGNCDIFVSKILQLFLPLYRKFKYYFYSVNR